MVLFAITYSATCFLYVLILNSFISFADQVCYGDLGCFTDTYPCSRTKSFPPRSPDFIQTKFYLYTRNSNNAFKIDRNDASTLQKSTFDSSKNTIFLIHGYTESGLYSNWVNNVRNQLLNLEKQNVIAVDWERGAKDIYYKSVQNIQVVGAEVAKFIELLNNELGYPNKNIYIIGHSLGAHAAGYAGAASSGIGRITGLDPAGPEFRYLDPTCRLDPSDASLVDNIHTDGERLDELGFGLLQPLGHMDFYPNSGKEQPGCPVTVFDALADIDEVSCSHGRSHLYFLESMGSASCRFKSTPCSTWDRYVAGKCSCGSSGCPEMGYYADQSSARGNFYLVTGSSSPYYEEPDCGTCIRGNNRVPDYLSFLISTVAADKVCYGDLGCFTDDPPCDTFRDFPPRSPDYINTNFLLYTRLNDDIPMTIDRTNPSSLKISTFNSLKRTVFLIHGYTEAGLFSDWVQNVKTKLLEIENVNVIVVDWGIGAHDIYYKSVQNIRVVGAELGMFIQFLNKELGYPNRKVHIIGHSLGAHTAGYAGAMNPGIARITGLDPAGPEFRYNHPDCRLDPTDAVLVDNIHTDGETLVSLGFGLLQPLGHMDFYPNSGKEQPGCPATVFDALAAIDEVSCSHSRSHLYFLESMDQSASCQFKSYPCASWDRFVDGKCSDCGLFGCPVMGYYADLSLASGSFYLNTRSSEPFCK
ncbi:uncharacterized protein [Antedon mediterranea]|uniref:uncharacterized protein n=1 Tax=Antedon mediterranea TaxID=105859 RepID=UPI003AF8985A